MSATASQDIVLKSFRSPRTVIGRFVAKRTIRGSALWSLVLGAYVASKAIGFVHAYTNEAARQKVIELFSNNIGIEIMLGPLGNAHTTAAYVAWNCLNVTLIIASIWAILTATKYFRGEEDNGRWELLLVGQTTQRRGAVNNLAAFGAILAVFYVIFGAILIKVGKTNGVDFGTSSALFFSLAVTLGAGMFMSIGALTSQLMSTRGKASGVGMGILGIFFAIRAVGDITSLHWLLYLTPFGWIEKLQVLSNSQPIWLLPIIVVLVICLSLTIYFAGVRDLGTSILADGKIAKSRYRLLNNPVGAAFRLTKMNAIAWLSSIFLSSLLYGLVTKSVTAAFNQSTGGKHVLKTLLSNQSTATIAVAFLGVVFFLQMIVIMSYTASSFTAVRRDESEGYVDNFLVRPISRVRWLSGRVFLTVSAIVLAGVLTVSGVWIGLASQHISVPFHTLFEAGANALVAGIFVVGVAVLVFGIRPRLTSMAAYGVLVWSFLIYMLSSGLNLSHWILDTSLFHQIAFAPAVSVDWSTDLIIVIVAIALGLIGMTAFTSRDLQGE